MNQNQEREVPKTAQKAAEEALSATFAIPPIRTMADDIAESSKKGSSASVVQRTTTKDVQTEPIRPVLRTTVNERVKNTPPPESPPVIGTPRYSTPPPSSQIVKKQPASQTVVLPEKEKKSGVGSSVLIGAFVSLLICVAIGAGWYFWPRKTQTVADKIPAEAVSYIGLSSNSQLKDTLFPKLVESFGLEKEAIGNSWDSLALVALPGSSSSEPIQLLLVNGGSIDLAGVTTLTKKNLPSGSTVIIANDKVGRIDGLSGKTLGQLSEYRKLFKKLPQSTDYFYAKESELSAFLKAFVYLPVDYDKTTLGTLSKGSEEGVIAVKFVQSTGSTEKNTNIDWQKLAKAVPADVVAATGHASLNENVEKWRLSQSNDPRMQDFLNELNNKGSSLEKIRADVSGSYIAGSLNNTVDGFAVIDLKQDKADEIKSEIKNLEDAIRKTGPLISGTTYNDVNFDETQYKDTNVRFVNFGDSAHTFDYAIVDSYLLVSTSKEAMLKMLDTYFSEDQNNFSQILAAQNSSNKNNWQYVKFPQGSEKLTSFWKTMIMPFNFLFIAPDNDEVYSGVLKVN